MKLTYLIVGGKTYDLRDFFKYKHSRGSLKGRTQYRHRTRGFWGPLVGYEWTRWIFSINYEDDHSPMHWEVCNTATIPAAVTPEKYDDYMETLAILAVEEYVNRYGISWEIEIKNPETMESTNEFENKIKVDLYDLRRSNRAKPIELSFDWTLDKAREIGGMKIRKRKPKTKKAKKNRRRH
jgi:hypothetical protein